VSSQGQHNGYNKAEAREMALRCVESYREHIQNFARMTVLERWYEHIDASDILSAISGKKWRRVAIVCRLLSVAIQEHRKKSKSIEKTDFSM
jgi:hypothetical protein